MIETIDNNAKLRSDVKKLGNILGEILIHHGGMELFNKVETIRELTKTLRKEYNQETYNELKNEISSLEPPMRQYVIRAFSIYFHLINIAEQNHRIRRRKQYLLEENSYQKYSLEDAVSRVKEYDLSKDALEEVLNDLSIELIITAHPTEATKRSVLEIQKRISNILIQLDSNNLTKKDRINLEDSLFNEVTALWQTDELRHRKPKVLDEVRNGLYYFDERLFDIIPSVHEELELQLNETFTDHKFEVPNFLHFGSWIGGDRDGNPNVTTDITWTTLNLQRELVLKKYDESLVELMKRFSQSTNRVEDSKALIESAVKEEQNYLQEEERWQIDSEIYRRKFAIIIKRIREVGKSNVGYRTAEEFLNDLLQVKNSAEMHQPLNHRLKAIRRLIRQVELFGFHLATLDIRNHSGEHEAAVNEMLRAVGIADNYSAMSEAEKQATLQNVLTDPRPLLLFEGGYTKETEEVIKVFKMIRNAHKEFGKRSIEVYLISMTQAPSDLLEVLVLAKEAGIYRLHADGTVESDL